MISAADAVRYLTSGKSIMDSICDLIIRPPRAAYDPALDLGPEIFRIGDDDPARYQRRDISLENMRGVRLEASWFTPVDFERRPCVVYLHGNCGSRYDALEALFLLRHGFSLFTFDASGSGVSEGIYISLGFYERQDLAAVVDYLTSQEEVNGIGLWGRSMGAVTSIMYAAKDTSIRCLVCDSPFSTLRLLINDLVRRHLSKRVPSGIVDSIVNRIRKRITKRAAFDIDDLDALKYASECIIPTFIFHGKDDDFVLPKHSIAVCNSYKGSCLHHVVDGGHNDERDDTVKETIISFFTLYLIQKPEGEKLRQTQEKPVILKGKPEPTIVKNQTENVIDKESNESETVEGEPASPSEDSDLGVTPSEGKNYAPLAPISFTKLALHRASASPSQEHNE